MHSITFNRRHAASIAILGALALAGCEQKPPSSALIVRVASLDMPTTPARSEKARSDSTRMDALLAQAGAAPESSAPSAAADAPKPRASLPQSPPGAGKPSAGRPVSDADLAARVKSALLAQPLSALLFNVNVSNGVVTLSGTADSAETRDKAARTAAAVQGVKSVNNRINVLSGS